MYAPEPVDVPPVHVAHPLHVRSVYQVYVALYHPEPAVHVTQVRGHDAMLALYKTALFWAGHVADVWVVEFPQRRDISHKTIPTLGHFHKMPETDHDPAELC